MTPEAIAIARAAVAHEKAMHYQARGTDSIIAAYVEWLEARLAEVEAFKPTHRHYRGGLYQVMHRDALHAEAELLMVVYRNQHGEIFVRLQAMFDETVFYPGINEHVPRFAALSPAGGEWPGRDSIGEG